VTVVSGAGVEGPIGLFPHAGGGPGFSAQIGVLRRLPTGHIKEQRRLKRTLIAFTFGKCPSLLVNLLLTVTL
jgi:hypothetical protein